MRPSADHWAYLMLSGSALFWSGNFVIGRAFSSDIGPFTLSYWRWLVALLVFFPLGIRYLLRDWAVIRRCLPWLSLMGLIGVAGFNTCVYLGLQHTMATNALLINSFIPIIIILLSALQPGVAISRLQLTGVAVSTAGMMLLISHGRLGNLLSLQFNQGDLWVLLAALLWALYSIALKWRPSALSAPAFLLASMLVGVLLLTPLYLFNPLDEAPIQFSGGNIVAIGYVALFASIGSFMLWNQGVRQLGAATAGQFIHLMPVFGALMAVVFLGEQLAWFHVAGALAIGGGIYLSLSGKVSTPG